MKITFRKLTAALPLVTFLTLPTLTPAETGVQAWVQRYNGPGNGSDKALAVAVDTSSNVVVTGGANDGGGVNPCTTIRYSNAGMPLWTNRYTAAGSSGGTGNAVVVDGNDDVVVTGNSLIGMNNDYATIKYSSMGEPLWTNRYNGPGNRNDVALAVAADGSNDVIVTGYSANSGSSQAYATVKYSSAGVPLWTNRYAGPANSLDQATAVAVDGSNNVIVTGYSYGAAGNVDYATIMYSGAGIPLWTNRYNGPGNGADYANAVAVGSNNNVIVTGSSADSGGKADYATIKYSSAGEPLWTNRYNGPANGTDSPSAIAVDGNNSVVVTGSSGPFTSPLPSSADYATIKYSSGGVPVWVSRYTAPASGISQPRGMALDQSGNVFVAGYSRGSGSGDDFTTIKYISVPSPLMTSLQVTNGTFQMEVHDVLQPGTLVIEASTKLTGWTPIFTNAIPTNVVYYTDPDVINAPTRFYRAFQFP